MERIEAVHISSQTTLDILRMVRSSHLSSAQAASGEVQSHLVNVLANLSTPAIQIILSAPSAMVWKRRSRLARQLIALRQGFPAFD